MADVGVGLVVEQQPDHRLVAVLRGRQQRLAEKIAAQIVRRRAGRRQQRVHHAGVSARRRAGQSRRAEHVLEVNVGTRIQQQAHHRDPPVAGGLHQRRPAILRLHIDFCRAVWVGEGEGEGGGRSG